MKKSFLAVITAIVVGFISALGLCIQALNVQKVAAFSYGNMRIVLDAGHGGVDGGVAGRATGVKESDLNLAIAMEAKRALEDMGFEITLTRRTKSGLYGTTAKGFKKRDMQRRKEIIERVDPALVVSVHQNFYPSKATRGAQVFYLQGSQGSKRLAEGMQSRLNALYAEQGVSARKIMKGEYFILQCTAAPSIIVECGFLSNESDEALLVSTSWQKRFGEQIATGVLGYFAEISA